MTTVAKLIEKFDEDDSKKLLGLFTEELNDYEKKWTVNREEKGPSVAIYCEPGNANNCQQDVDKLIELLDGLKGDVIDCRHQKTPKEEIIGTLKKEVNVVFIISRQKENMIRIFAKCQSYLDDVKRKLNEIQSTSIRQGRSFCAGKPDTDNKPSSRRNRIFPNQHVYDNPDDSGGKPNNGSTVSPDDIKKSFCTKNGLTVKIYKGPITKLGVDAVVNAANERLANGAGVAGALSKAGGHDFDKKCEAVIRRDGFIPVTRNVVTGAGAMAYDGVIHAVGPQWYNYTDKVECVEKVRDTVIEILKTSVNAGFKSVAMPPISSGLFGVPTDLCAAMYIQGIIDFSENTSQLNKLKEFHIIDIKDDILDMVIHFYGIWKQNPQALAPYTLVSQHPKAGKGSNLNKSWDGKKDWNAGQGRRHDQGHPRGIQSYSEGHDGHQDYPQRPDGHQGYHQRHDGHQGYPQGHDGHQGYPQRHDGHQGYPKRHDGHQGYPQRHDDHQGYPQRRDGGHQGYHHVGRGKPRIPCVFSEKENCFIFREKLKVFIYSTNIIDLKVDAIVATDGKEHKGAISKAIEQANGQTRWNQFKNLVFSSFSSNEELQEGQVYFVKPNKMKHLRCIYQIIMKRFSPFVSPTQRELSSLKNIVLKVLSQANSLSRENKKQKCHPLKRIAMSIPGSGSLETRLYVEKCSEVMFRAIDEFTQRPEMISLMEIHLVDVREDHIIKVLKDTFHKQVKHLTQMKRPLPQRPPNKPLGASGYYDTIPDVESKKTHGRFQTDGHCHKIETWRSDSRRFSRKISIDQFADRVSERKGNMIILSGGSSSHRGGAIGAAGGDETGDDCVICMDSFEDPVKLKKCGHKFCKECISESFQQKPVCPVCATVYTVVQGDQPVKGVAEVYKDDKSLPGYPGCKTFIINYDFPDGKQGEEHPEPGEEYKGLNRQAYLPDNTQGEKVLKMLKEAFEQRLIFTVGQSRTTGEDNVVTWNDIHHKTRREGGPARFGYPDDEYLDRVTDELNAKGIGL
ncbi:uncharacterized protein [Argopecten irradians]|uniref:uncharacterized protein isoform X2 n=1 Tax=Argopecten irradians TaxID=31199 RepID=UPI0037231067